MNRAYTQQDWEVVREIYDLAKPDEMLGAVPIASILPLAKDAEMLKLFRESEIIVAEENKEIVGFAGYKGSFISWLFVHPAHRKKGIASSLVISMVNSLEGDAALNVAKTNISARKLYSRLGFIVEREYEGQFNGYPCEVIRMRYRVPPQLSK